MFSLKHLRALLLAFVVCSAIQGFAAKEESKDKVDVGTVIGIDLGKFLVVIVW